MNKTPLSPKSHPGFESGFLEFWIDPYTDSDVCQIAPEIYWIHFLVNTSHLANYHKKWPVIV